MPTDARLTKEQRDRIEMAAKGGGYYGPLSSEDLRTLLADYDARGEALQWVVDWDWSWTPPVGTQVLGRFAKRAAEALAASPPPPVQAGEPEPDVWTVCECGRETLLHDSVPVECPRCGAEVRPPAQPVPADVAEARGFARGVQEGERIAGIEGEVAPDVGALVEEARAAVALAKAGVAYECLDWNGPDTCDRPDRVFDATLRLADALEQRSARRVGEDEIARAISNAMGGFPGAPPTEFTLNAARAVLALFGEP